MLETRIYKRGYAVRSRTGLKQPETTDRLFWKYSKAPKRVDSAQHQFVDYKIA